MNSEATKTFNHVLLELTENVAFKFGLRGFKPADVSLHAKKNPVIKVALRSRFVSEYELRTRISQTLSTRTFQKQPRFLRVTDERPGLWKAIDFCNAQEVMAAAKNRSRLINSVAESRDTIVLVAERMFSTGEKFSEAWKQVRAAA